MVMIDWGFETRLIQKNLLLMSDLDPCLNQLENLVFILHLSEVICFKSTYSITFQLLWLLFSMYSAVHIRITKTLFM